MRTVELIAAARGEIVRPRQEIQFAWNTLDRSHELLSRTRPSTHCIATGKDFAS
jgi:hypothetical protein